MTAADYARHVEALCRAFNVVIKVSRNMRPDEAGAGYLRVRGMRTEQPMIVIAPIIDESTYAVALHEIGHCVAPTGNLYHERSLMMKTTGCPNCERDVLLQWEEERAAWAWAKHNALEWTPLMRRVRKMGLLSYRRRAFQLLGRRLP